MASSGDGALHSCRIGLRQCRCDLGGAKCAAEGAACRQPGAHGTPAMRRPSASGAAWRLLLRCGSVSRRCYVAEQSARGPIRLAGSAMVPHTASQLRCVPWRARARVVLASSDARRCLRSRCTPKPSDLPSRSTRAARRAPARCNTIAMHGGRHRSDVACPAAGQPRARAPRRLAPARRQP